MDVLTMARLKTEQGATWCFTHECAMPCEKCEAVRSAHPFIGMCFDCKREGAIDGEQDVEHCGCGGTVRRHNFYRYP